MRNQTMRCRRVADSLKKEISSMLLLEVKDPRIAFVTIIDVAVSPDLRLAEINVLAPKYANVRFINAHSGSRYEFAAKTIDTAVSPDLRLAEIYYTVHGSALDKENTQAGLRSSSGFMRRELGRRLHLKRIPELDFRYDQSVDHGFRIDQLLDELSGS